MSNTDRIHSYGATFYSSNRPTHITSTQAPFCSCSMAPWHHYQPTFPGHTPNTHITLLYGTHRPGYLISDVKSLKSFEVNKKG